MKYEEKEGTQIHDHDHVIKTAAAAAITAKLFFLFYILNAYSIDGLAPSHKS